MTTNWVGWILSVGVLLLLFISGYIMQNSVRLLLTGKRADGIVVEMYSSTRITSEPENLPMLTPLVEFVTSEGEHIRVHGRSYSLKPSSKTGDEIKVAYDKSNPKNAQLLLWGEFPLGPAGFFLGFAIILILMWMAGILISGDSTHDDPFHLLPALIAHFHMNPVRFPIIFLLTIIIPVCILGTYLTSQRAIDMLKNGIKTVGYVTGTERVSFKNNDGTMGSAVFPMITFKDESGVSHNIHGSTTKPLSRLSAGDQVEVIYLASNPNKGVVNTWYEFWVPPLFFGFVTVAFLVLFVLMLKEYKGIDSETGDPGIYNKLKTSGVPAIATVLKVNPKARYLHYRIEKDTLIPCKQLDNFVSFEREFSFWIPTQTGAEIKKGNQFRAYLDSLKPFEKFYIDFSQRLGTDRNVKSMEEEDTAEDKNNK